MTIPNSFPRYIFNELKSALSDFPVVLIHGARQCGKTTLARQFEPEGYAYISFDDEALLARARSNPKGFVADLPRRVILDEVQRVPQIFRSLKMSVDNDRQPGRFIMTGSANVMLLPKLGDSLAGRMCILELAPLGQAEIAGKAGHGKAEVKRACAFLLNLLKGKFKGFVRGRRLGAELAARIVAGGFPPAVAKSSAAAVRWYKNYAKILVQRDVKELSRIQNLSDLPPLLEGIAGQTGRLLNVSDLAVSFKLSRPTISQYITLLSNVFLLDTLQPWHTNHRSRLIKTPKLHIVDTGLACALLGINAQKLWGTRDIMLGHMLESFVYQELRRQASWLGEGLRFSHFRSREQDEVDIVIEKGDSVYGVEVKASASLQKRDFKGLYKLQEAAGEKFAGGVLLHDGDLTHRFKSGGKNIAAVPLSMLWEEGE